MRPLIPYLKGGEEKCISQYYMCKLLAFALTNPMCNIALFNGECEGSHLHFPFCTAFGLNMFLPYII